MAFLELKGVAKSYGSGAKRVSVLRDMNLSMERGEFVAIVGYSGAGKTTLMSMIAGLVSPDAGEVMLDGKRVIGPGPDRALVFQNYSLLPWLTVFENIYLGVDQIHPHMPRSWKTEYTEKYIAMVSLTPARDKLPSQLSGGMRQRVSVARALAMDPQVLLLDEPLGALDALTRANLQDEIARIAGTGERKTVLLITNDVDEGILLADRIIPLSAGPEASLGPAITVNLPRPRDRAGINHCPEFKRIRGEVFDWLLGPGRKSAGAAASSDARTPLPDISPIHHIADSLEYESVREATAARRAARRS